MRYRIPTKFAAAAICSGFFLTGCLCGESEPQIEEEPIPPILERITASMDQVEVERMVRLTTVVDAPEDTNWYLEWDSTCGTVIQVPGDANRATFTAPTTPRVCNITATVYDKHMDYPSSREIQIQVNETLESEIIR